MTCLLILSGIADAETPPRQTKIVGWLNEQLAGTDYKSSLIAPLCETRNDPIGEVSTCTYKFNEGSYISVAETKENLISFMILVPMLGDSFESIERESMYIFSLFVWGTMPETATYDDANDLLLDLYNLSFEQPIAETVSGNWSFAISEVKTCPFGVLVLVSQDTRTGLDGSDAVASLIDYGCKFLPGLP
jgi:hypothetical protein